MFGGIYNNLHTHGEIFYFYINEIHEYFTLEEFIDGVNYYLSYNK